MSSSARKIAYAVVVFLLAMGAMVSAEDAVLKPYLLGYRDSGIIKKRIIRVRTAVEKEGFQIVGKYEPYNGTHVMVVTDDTLKDHVAKSLFGAYGAIQCIALTETGKELQVAYTNPLCMAQIYRMKNDLADVAARMHAALGKIEDFGSKKGFSAAALRDYYYMVFMPYFTGRIKLASHGSYDAEAGLAEEKGETIKVCRVDIPGEKESVFGVGIREGEGRTKRS
jgi:hypothetical protein